MVYASEPCVFRRVGSRFWSDSLRASRGGGKVRGGQVRRAGRGLHQEERPDFHGHGREQGAQLTSFFAVFSEIFRFLKRTILFFVKVDVLGFTLKYSPIYMIAGAEGEQRPEVGRVLQEQIRVRD